MAFAAAYECACRAFRRMTRRLADAFCDGSPVQLIAQLIRSENLSAEDIRELQRLTAEKALEKPKKPKKS